MKTLKAILALTVVGILGVATKAQTELTHPMVSDVNGDGLDDVVTVDYVSPYEVRVFRQKRDQSHAVFGVESGPQPWDRTYYQIRGNPVLSGDVMIVPLMYADYLTNTVRYVIEGFIIPPEGPIQRSIHLLFSYNVPITLELYYIFFYGGSSIKNFRLINVEEDYDRDGRKDFMVAWAEYFDGYGAPGISSQRDTSYFMAQIGTSRGVMSVRDVTANILPGHVVGIPNGEWLGGNFTNFTEFDTPIGGGSQFLIGANQVNTGHGNERRSVLALFDSDMNCLGTEFREGLSIGQLGELGYYDRWLFAGRFILTGLDNVVEMTTYPYPGSLIAYTMFSHGFLPYAPFVGNFLDMVRFDHTTRLLMNSNNLVADFNNDGFEEVAAIHVVPQQQIAHKYLAIFSPTFTFAHPFYYREFNVQAQPFHMWLYVNSLALGDFNNDGFVDIFVPMKDMQGTNRPLFYIWQNISTPTRINGYWREAVGGRG